MAVELTVGERRLPREGLHQWGGPAGPTDELAAAMGFGDVSQLLADTARLSEQLGAGASLSPRDLKRALVATEIVFASDVFGAGVEWSIVTGLTDEETIAALRLLQRKLIGEYAGM
jgi:hypothetical protein